MNRPGLLVVVAGTGTEVGKTWVTARLASRLRQRGHSVAARKPAQSFAPTDTATDAGVLAAATGEWPHEVCPLHRWYPLPMAPPMAAAALGRSSITLAELVDELSWSLTDSGAPVDVGLLEGAGGVRSPLADDADLVDLIDVIEPDLVVIVAHAGLGAINDIRLTAAALASHPLVVVLNRYDPSQPLHRANRSWLAERTSYEIRTDVDSLAEDLLDRGIASSL